MNLPLHPGLFLLLLMTILSSPAVFIKARNYYNSLKDNGADEKEAQVETYKEFEGK